MDLIEIWLDLADFASESSESLLGQLDSVFHVKTHQPTRQPTCRIQFLDM